MTKSQIIDRVNRAIGQRYVGDTSDDYDYGRQIVKDLFYDFLMTCRRNNTKAYLIADLKARYHWLMRNNFSYRGHLGIVDELKRYDFIISL